MQRLNKIEYSYLVFKVSAETAPKNANKDIPKESAEETSRLYDISSLQVAIFPV